MSEQRAWQDLNNHYLAQVMVWLRVLLARAENRVSVANQGSTPATPAEGVSHDSTSERDAPTDGDHELKEAELAVREAESIEPPPAALLLTRLLGLSEFEKAALLLCVGVELDTRIASGCDALQHPLTGGPSFGLMLSILPSPAWEALSPEAPLRYYRLLEGVGPFTTLTTVPLRIEESILHFVKGLHARDERTFDILSTDVAERPNLAPSQLVTCDAIAAAISRSPALVPPVVELIGPDSATSSAVTFEACQRLQYRLEVVRIENLQTRGAEFDLLSRILQRQCALLGAALFFDLTHADEVQHQICLKYLSSLRALSFVATREPLASGARTKLSFEVQRPSPEEQVVLWQQALGELAGVGTAPILLASHFNLDANDIHRIATRWLSEPETDRILDRLFETCRAFVRPKFETLAQPLRSDATWASLVLPEEEMSLLRQLVAQMQNRHRVYREWGFGNGKRLGLGISALFAGPSGTGKTLAAQVVANELKLDLIRIDLSSVVNKYIGETEKNLRRLFDAAENGGTVLLFDEADALFGQRTEVKQSHDRYANIEIDYLLQRLESYSGMVILATNLRSAIDRAFLRRLRFLVQFPFPAAAQRKQIWQHVFPAQTPLGLLDWEHLAKLDLTGGNIYTIAMNAAFAAAAEGTPVTMPQVLQAAKNELRKVKASLNEAQLRWSPAAATGAQGGTA